MTPQPYLIYAGDPDSVRTTLESAEWGYAEMLNTRFHICPWCQAMMPSSFNNAHEPGVTTPKAAHIDYHVNVAIAIQTAGKPQFL